jgi:hypothetical protein
MMMRRMTLLQLPCVSMSLSNHNAFETALLNAHLYAYPLPSTGIHDPAQYTSSRECERSTTDLTCMKQALCASASASFEAKKGFVFATARPMNHACSPSHRELRAANFNANSVGVNACMAAAVR